MSKKIKQMEMDTLKSTFQGVRDLVMMSVVGLGGTPSNQVRLTLRKKNIRLQVVKNSLAKRIFDEMGITLAGIWEGNTTLAWGGTSVADLCKELDTLLKKNEKVKFKGAVADGQQITFEQGLKMPTRAEALGRVVMLAMAPARRLASQIVGPASQVAGQIKSLKDKAESPEAAPAA
jgi:large subunit ribosomal protein L10